MKIVVLNECFLEDKHIARLKSLGEVEIYLDTDTEEKALERLQNADIAIADCFLAPLNKNVLSALPKLRYITINTTGYDLVDLDTAKEKSIQVSNVPGFATEAVAEQVIALLFAVVRKIPIFDQKMRQKPYEVDPGDPKDLRLKGFNLFGKTMGIIGLGSIGSRVAQLAQGLGMNVVAYSKSDKELENVKIVDLDTLLSSSDVISLHLPLNSETANFIGEAELSKMKHGSVLINTARGKHVDSIALHKALVKGKLFGAGLDVIDNTTSENPLLALDNVVFTPHSAWMTRESLQVLAGMIVSNVENFVKGTPTNLLY